MENKAIGQKTGALADLCIEAHQYLAERSFKRATARKLDRGYYLRNHFFTIITASEAVCRFLNLAGRRSPNAYYSCGGSQ